MRRAYSFIYITNIVFQAIFTLLFHIVTGLLLSWLLVEKFGLPNFIYAILIIIGVIIGLLSMIKFILVSMRALDHLEKSHKENWRKNERSK